jgi:hypothetical protein
MICPLLEEDAKSVAKSMPKQNNDCLAEID